jgi:hypothetical protein
VSLSSKHNNVHWAISAPVDVGIYFFVTDAMNTTSGGGPVRYYSTVMWLVSRPDVLSIQYTVVESGDTSCLCDPLLRRGDGMPKKVQLESKRTDITLPTVL